MCRNLIFSSITQSGARVPVEIFESLLDSAKNNDDGFALFILYPDYENHIVRTLSFYEYVKALLELDSDNERILLMHTHQRAATAGSVTVDNVHLWIENNIAFSHNGFVLKYAPHMVSINPYIYKIPVTGEKSDTKCDIKTKDSDSKQFFYNNVDEISRCLRKNNPDKLIALCRKENLSGIVMVNNINNGRFMAVGVGRTVHLYISTERDYIAISNIETIELRRQKHIECEWIYGTAGTPHFSFKKSRKKTFEIPYLHSNRNIWYYYDYYD